MPNFFKVFSAFMKKISLRVRCPQVKMGLIRIMTLVNAMARQFFVWIIHR